MNATLSSFVRTVLALTTATALAGCMAATDDAGDEATEALSGHRVEAISTNDVIARAREWVDVGMPYCGGPNGGADVLCGGTCVRNGAARNPAWDAYRSDCSGLVSYAWGLPAPGRVTSTLPDVSQAISGWDLAPGDILNNSYHVVLFSGWVNKDAGTARIIHEPDCGKQATELTVTLGIGQGSYVSLWGDGYTALRYINMEGASSPASDACGDLTYQGACDGNVLLWCENGGVRTFDCGASGKGCGWESDAVGNNCVDAGAPPPPADTPENSCGGVDYHGYCDGNTLVWCQEGELRSFDCGAESLTCKWQNDAEGNNCL
jgi:hypothetical protein